MWPEPDPATAHRMHAAHHHAQQVLNLQPEPGATPIWGWRGRTLSRPVTAPDGPVWLRISSAPADHVADVFWNGAVDAQACLPASIPRPRLHTHLDFTHQPWAYRAELYDRVAATPIAPTAAIRTAPDLPTTWWAALRSALDHLTATPTNRRPIHPHYLHRTMPRFLGEPIDTNPPAWSTAHGDLHFANLCCAPTLTILDWEGWGLAPTGYDAATLHTYSLLNPALTTRIRTELGHILDTPAGHFAELAVIAELLHNTTRGAHPHLIEPLRNRAAHLLGRPIPHPRNTTAVSAEPAAISQRPGRLPASLRQR